MKKSYKLKNLDCANCAAKMEAAINRLPEIESANVSFMTQRMTLNFAESADESATMKKVIKCIARVEPDCEVVGV